MKVASRGGGNACLEKRAWERVEGEKASSSKLPPSTVDFESTLDLKSTLDLESTDDLELTVDLESTLDLELTVDLESTVERSEVDNL